jgi:hypothetical protein
VLRIAQLTSLLCGNPELQHRAVRIVPKKQEVQPDISVTTSGFLSPISEKFRRLSGARDRAQSNHWIESKTVF